MKEACPGQGRGMLSRHMVGPDHLEQHCGHPVIKMSALAGLLPSRYTSLAENPRQSQWLAWTPCVQQEFMRGGNRTRKIRERKTGRDRELERRKSENGKRWRTETVKRKNVG